MKRNTFILFLLLSFTISNFPLNTYAMKVTEDVASPQQFSGSYTEKAVKFKLLERKLWTDHVIWLNAYISAVLENKANKQEILERALENQEDIGDAFASYYGEEVGEKISKLLKQHVLLTGKVAAATKKGNAAELKSYKEEWFNNSANTADLLASLNNKWTDKKLEEILFSHLKLENEIIDAQVANDWDEVIDLIDSAEEHMLTFADFIADGIIDKFPNKFQ